jgi:methionyl-tRNA formyltransferase
MEAVKVVFAGTPEFALPSLEALANHPQMEVAAVYTQPDRPAGRGKKLTPSPVKRLAVSLGVPVLQPDTLKTAEAVETLQNLGPALMVVTAYGLILPSAILAVPRLGCVNVHASLLPRWRGAAPIQRAIEAGDTVTGVTLMQMESGLDSGPMLASETVTIEPLDTAASLHDRLAAAGGRLLAENLDALLNGELEPEPQAVEGVTYATKLSREESVVDWHLDAESISRRIRAFNPWPMAETRLGEVRLRLLLAEPVANCLVGEMPGEVLSANADGIVISCGDGAVRVTQLQKPGSRPMAVRDFLNGNPIAEGQRLG